MQQQVFQWVRRSVVKAQSDLLSFLYPPHCVVCNVHLPDGLNHFCLLCASELHYTYFESYENSSPLDEVFWGKVQLTSSYSLLYFSKMGGTQKIIHSIKYKGNQSLAIELGKSTGGKLLEKWNESRPDYLLPIPLHPKKRFKRGFNQSEEIAKGISIQTGIPIDSSVLFRSKNTKTQTKKSKLERWDNVDGIFSIHRPEHLKNKHICLVDDVITTGATIEACIRALQASVENCSISVVSLAFAR